MELLKQIQGRLAIGTLTARDKAAIEELYLEVLGRTLVRRSCNDCYRDAVIEIKIKQRKTMEKPKYALKNGVVLYQHATGKVFSNFNITDKIAAEHLREHPDDVRFFAVYPPIEQIAATVEVDQTPKATPKKRAKTTI